MGFRATIGTKLQVQGGATVATAHQIDMQAFGQIEVTVPSAGSATVEIQPGGAGKVSLLQIESSVYSVGVVYEMDGSGTQIPLDAPQLFLGAGAVGLLGSVNSAEFSNPHTEDVEIRIVVGRNATT